jgi:hypothetical protein
MCLEYLVCRAVRQLDGKSPLAICEGNFHPSPFDVSQRNRIIDDIS